MSIGQYFDGYKKQFPLTERIQMSIMYVMYLSCLTAEDFGEMVGVSPSTVRAWEAGRVEKIHHNNMRRLWPVIHDKLMAFTQQRRYEH